MTDAEQSARTKAMEATTAAVLNTLCLHGLGENDVVSMCGVLGAVVGCVALASDTPQLVIAKVNLFAEGVVSGHLLDADGTQAG